ncbi:Gfo/Idh/MocA family protein [Thermophagus xiamenensis]|uniref:Tat (Twin-arginine translocation) pathway signal sequence n=1 Tax=Thermophagus xiamenensis TaxID=385682 RepID=A0A1I1XEN8_9BACT|nr:Gfo/Idh/MocA family oxidoreductase [Thermophagus xiamenensis]SFE05874.1 Tat (twin-arginine translocation) pathway signal sequence [Thermophagus xiamenensis]
MSKQYQSRREFLKKLAITGSVATLAASPWIKAFSDNTPIGKNPSDKVRLAVIGTGSRGKQLMRYLFRIANANNIEICALCDVYQPHLDKAINMCQKENIKVKSYNNYQDLITKEKPDGVIIATPLHQHAHITIDCLKHGIHVFCEKAMARTLDDTKAMYDAHKETGKILQIGHQRLFNPVYLEGMKRIHNGELGTIGQIRAYWHRNNNWRRKVPDNTVEMERFINWRLYKEYSAGLLTELLSHQIQVANWALQKTPVSVMGTGSIVFWKDGREVEDNVALIYTYDNGVQFIYDSMISNKKYGLEEQVMGHKGTIEFEVNRYYTETPPPAPGILQLLNDIESGFFEKVNIGGASWIPETAVKYQGEPIIEDTDFYDSALQLEGFAQYIRKGKAPEKMIIEGYNASIWTLLAEIAIDTGKKVALPEKYRI